MKKNSLLVLFFGIFSLAFAQQESQYTQYMYNTLAINPGYTGSKSVGTFFGIHRAQWIGIDGAPRTSAFSYHTPISYKNLGVGGTLFYETIGPTTFAYLIGDVSYTLNFENDSKLGLGLKATLGMFGIDYSKLHIKDGGDRIFVDPNAQKKIFSPNIGTGIYWYSKNYYLGISIPNLLQTDTYDSDRTKISVVRNSQHYYLIGGYVFDFSKNFKFKPAVLTKLVEGSPLQLDVSANFMFNDKFVFGAAWRWSAAISGMVGFQFTPNWFIGYGYDFETTELSKYNSGSHEIFLRYELYKVTKKIISPRFF